MNIKRLLISLLSAIALMLSACSIYFTTEFNDDGSGEFMITFTVTEEDIEDVEDEFDQNIDDILDDEFGESNFEDACEEMEDQMDLPRSADSEFSEGAGAFKCEIIIPFDDIDELIEIYEDIDIVEVKDIDLDRDGDFNYEMDIDMVGAEDADEFGVRQIEYYWEVTVPGSVEDSNADDAKGRTVTWELDPGYIQKIEVFGGPGGLFAGLTNGSSFWWIAGIGLLCLFGLVLVGGGVGFYFYAQKKKED